MWRGDLAEGFLRYRFGGLIFGGAFTWRGLFSEFYGITMFPAHFEKLWCSIVFVGYRNDRFFSHTTMFQMLRNNADALRCSSLGYLWYNFYRMQGTVNLSKIKTMN